MGFLMAKILLLLGLAAACGAAFAYWWFRRHYEDVSLEYARSREEWATWRRDFEARLAARPPADLTALSGQLAALEAAVRDIPSPEPPDLRPLQEQLAALEKAVHDNRAPVDARLMAIEHSLFPVQTRIDELESAVRGLRMPAPDYAPVLERINQLQQQLENPPVRVREGTRNLLSRPGHGEPDDLTQLKGVPKVLERTLHKVGVFYFWQIAEWSPDDVKYVDSKLAAYSGRIERDDWVSQAAELAAAPGAAARPPLEH